MSLEPSNPSLPKPFRRRPGRYRMRHALPWHFAPYLAPFHTHLNAWTLFTPTSVPGLCGLTCRGNDRIWGKGGVGALLTGRKDQWSQVPAGPQRQGTAPLKHWLGELCFSSYHKVGSVRVVRNILLKESSSSAISSVERPMSCCLLHKLLCRDEAGLRN